MRYLVVWFLGVIVIYNGLTDAGYYGPEMSLIFVPVWSIVLSCGVLLAATLIGLPIRIAAVSPQPQPHLDVWSSGGPTPQASTPRSRMRCSRCVVSSLSNLQ